MMPEEVMSFLKRASKATEALLTFGEMPEVNEKVRSKLNRIGYNNFIDYVYDICILSIKVGLLPHTNAGVLSYSQLKRLKDVNASMGLMLEQVVELECHSESPGKRPEVRIRHIKNAGKLKIPFTTGILIGIGESKYDREYSLEVISELSKNYGHIQEVIVQNFSPKKGTKMENFEPPTEKELIEVVKIARRIIPKDVAIQVPPNLVSDLYTLIKAGANDLGGISEITPDYINPEHPWPKLSEIEKKLRDVKLKERLPIYPKYIIEGWYSDLIAPLIEAYSDEDGFRC